MANENVCPCWECATAWDCSFKTFQNPFHISHLTILMLLKVSTYVWYCRSHKEKADGMFIPSSLWEGPSKHVLATFLNLYTPRLEMQLWSCSRASSCNHFQDFYLQVAWEHKDCSQNSLTTIFLDWARVNRSSHLGVPLQEVPRMWHRHSLVSWPLYQIGFLWSMYRTKQTSIVWDTFSPQKEP